MNPTSRPRFSTLNQPVSCRACSTRTAHGDAGLCKPCNQDALEENDHDDNHAAHVAGCSRCERHRAEVKASEYDSLVCGQCGRAYDHVDPHICAFPGAQRHLGKGFAPRP